MNRNFCKLALIVAGALLQNTLTTKSVEFKGPLLAPWVKGDLCVYFWHQEDHVQQCLPIKAGQDYIINNIPDNVTHIKITRSFDKQCSINHRSIKKCKTAKGKFFLTEPHTTLTLTYANKKILKDITIPPREAQSYFGYPQQRRSILFQSNYSSQPDSRAV